MWGPDASLAVPQKVWHPPPECSLVLIFLSWYRATPIPILPSRLVERSGRSLSLPLEGGREKPKASPFPKGLGSKRRGMLGAGQRAGRLPSCHLRSSPPSPPAANFSGCPSSPPPPRPLALPHCHGDAGNSRLPRGLSLLQGAELAPLAPRQRPTAPETLRTPARTPARDPAR